MDEAAQVIARLTAVGRTLVTAESCTGGLLGKLLTDVPGASAVYLGGIISYAYAVKERLLGVPHALLEAQGAVCEPVARRMAEGARSLLGADYALSVTGNAGPGADEKNPRVGEIFVACADAAGTRCVRLECGGTRGENREAACRAALRQVLAPFGGLAWVKPGMRIAVKANLVSAMKPERAATTHPMLLRVLTEALVRRGASVVVGDSPGGTYAAGHLNAVYRACGLAAVEEAGGTLNRNFAQREADLPDARVAKHITYTAYLDDADAIISFCKLKSHGMLALSAATKNLFGAIPGTIKPEYHYRYPDPMDFAGMLIDLNEHFRPRLYLVDAVVAMEGNGPTAGTPRPFGALLAGTNPHRIDLLCASLIGLKPENVPTLRAAAERGLTPLDPAQLCVAGDAAAFACPDFRIVQHGTGTDFGARGGTFGRLLGKTAALALRTRPGLKRALCVGCGVCRDVCPAHAITIANGRAHIDRGRCIHCFCCQEFCPRGAMQVHRTVIARIAGHL